MFDESDKETFDASDKEASDKEYIKIRYHVKTRDPCALAYTKIGPEKLIKKQSKMEQLQLRIIEIHYYNLLFLF